MKPENPPDLDWLAFLYVANELDDKDRDAFEQQLATDQAAREAVARAVELSQTVVAAQKIDRIVARALSAATPSAATPAAAKRAAWWQPLASMGAGGVACLLLVTAWSFWPASGRPVVASKNPVALALALAWSTAREEFAEHEALWAQELAQTESPHVATAFGDMRLEEELEDLDGIPTPSWMLSAVVAEDEPEAAANGLRGAAEDSPEVQEN